MTATTDPLFRDATVEDALAMLEVIGAAFARWPPVDVAVPPIEHLRWKMSPPGDIPLHHVIVFVEGRPAADQSRWVCRLQVGANDYIGDTPADLAVHPAFQGQGFSRLIKERDHARLVAGKAPGFDMLSNAPQVRHMNEPDLITRQMTTWFHPFRLRSYASAHYRHGGLPGLAGAVRRRLARRAATPRDPVRIEVLERFDERTDDLWEAARRSFDVLTFRDADYLNWRFARPLAGPVTILGLTEGARVHAYAVVRRLGDRGDLMDWLWTPAAESALPALLDAAMEHLRASGVRGVSCWLPAGHRAEPVLHEAGFAPVGTQTILLGSPERAESPPEVLAIFEDRSRTMHLTMSDFDFV